MRVMFDIDTDIFRSQTKLIGNNLRQHRAVPLSLRRGIAGNADRSKRINIHCRHRDRAILRAPLATLLDRHDGAEIAHIGHAGLNKCSIAYAVNFPGSTRLIATFQQFIETSLFDRHLDGLGVIT